MELSFEKQNLYKKGIDMTKMQTFCEGYLNFLSSCRTERKCVEFFKRRAVEKGYKPLEQYTNLAAGDKFYLINRGKAIFLGTIGTEPISEGIHMLAAHIDSPRIDLKPHPLFEADELALLRTHYYGGIRKYQWMTLPLAIEGIAILRDGRTVDLSNNDFTFCITDLLPHLASSQNKKPLSDAFEGEELKIICGSIPDLETEQKDKIKYAVLKILHSHYEITERELISAEISFVPKIAPAFVGFDKSLIGAYGQDDRVCAYTAFEAEINTAANPLTTLTCLVDKEEVGSDGVTGMKSGFFDMVIERLCGGKNALVVYNNSKCLSADVNAAFDPIYPSVLDKQNACLLGCGPAIMKYSGSRGKAGTSDASAETMGYFTNLFDDNGISWQTGQLGKVDEGGGGTVAMYIANRNIETLDMGVGLLSMHSPFEISSKADIYELYRAFKVFLQQK